MVVVEVDRDMCRVLWSKVSKTMMKLLVLDFGFIMRSCRLMVHCIHGRDYVKLQDLDDLTRIGMGIELVCFYQHLHPAPSL